jgi:hypothetical protein
MIKATVTNAKQLGAQRGGWASFKHRLMEVLGIPLSEFGRWDVPEEWKKVYCKANGRTIYKPFKIKD